MHPRHAVISATKILVAGLLVSLVLPYQVRAQWQPLPSQRYGLTPYSKNLQGMFFPVKKPEEQEITLGQIVLRPGLGVAGTYSNNLTLSEHHTKEDFLTTLFPAFLVQWPYRRHELEAEYLGALSWYINNPAFDATDHLFGARAQLNPSKHLQVNLNGSFGILHTATEDIPNVTGADALLFNRRRVFDYYQTSVALDYRKDRSYLHTDYSNEINTFHERIDKVDDFDRHSPQIRIGYYVFPQTSVVLGYRFEYWNGGTRNGTPSIDHTLHVATYGVDVRLFKKIEAKLLGTYNWLDYHDAAISSDYWGAWVDIVYTFSRRCTFYSSFRSLSSPVFVYTGQRKSGGLYYTEHNTSFSVEYAFRHNLFVWASSLYRNLRYPVEINRLDEEYGGIIQIVYRFRPWMRCGIIQAYAHTQSSMDDQDFEETRTQIYLQWAF